MTEVQLTEQMQIKLAIDWPEKLTGEMLLFGMLSRLLLDQPERTWFQSLIDEDLFGESPFAGDQPDVVDGLALLQSWSADWAGGIGDEQLLDLRVDYTRLFTGVAKLPVAPWESVYFTEERLLFREQTLAVRAWYRRFGLASEKLYNEPDDHIGLEVSFAAHLAREALEALAAGDAAEAQRLLDAQRDFLDQHLLRWGPLWCSLVERYAQSDFYRGLALLLRGAFKELAGLFELAITEIPVP